MNNYKYIGVFYVLISAAAFGVMPILAKLSYACGINAYMVLIFRYIFAMMMLIIYLSCKKVSLKISRKQFVYLFWVGIVGSGTSITLFLSYDYISVGIATTIFYIYPAIVTFMASIIYKEKLYFKKIAALLMSFIGIYVLVCGGHVKLSIIGILFALVSAILYSFYVIIVSSEEIKVMNSYVLAFYNLIYNGIITFLGGYCLGQINFKFDFFGLIYIVVMAFISTIVALVTFMKGVKMIGPSQSSIISTFEPIVSVVLGVIVLKESINIQEILGGFLIIISIFILSLNKNQVSIGRDEKNV